VLASIARRASTRLADAGRGALDRGDFNAGRALLRRAVELLPERDEARLALAPDFSAALLEAGSNEAWEVVVEAQQSSDRQTRARATLQMATWSLIGGYDRPLEQRLAWREEARSTFEQIGDERGLAQYWWSTSMEAWFGLRAQETQDACTQALEHLDRCGEAESRLGHNVRNRLLSTYVYVSLPVDACLEQIGRLEIRRYGLLAEAWERNAVGRLQAMKGEFDRGRELVRGARRAYLDAGMIQTAGGLAMGEGRVEWLAGADAAAEQVLREGIESLESIGERAFYPTAVLQLAAVLYAQGRYEEVREWCEKGRAASGDDDLANFLQLDGLEGCLLAREGRSEEAEEAARQAIRKLEGIEMNEVVAGAHASVAEIFGLTGEQEKAHEHASTALSLAEQKGDIALAARVRERLASVGVDTP
jgi:tetratricopeptide (TPR) repeat protein